MYTLSGIGTTILRKHDERQIIKRRRYPNAKYISNLIDKGHESVLEHANWTLLLDGVSRAFSHQLVRHRIGFSFSQLSQQYHEETEAESICPANLNDSSNPEAYKLWETSMEQSKQTYEKLLTMLADPKKDLSFEEMRDIRSAARSVLPNATETSIMITANARALRHFLDIRGNIIGDPEMRKVSAEIYKIMNTSAPSLFFDFETISYDDGSIGVVKSSK